MKHEQHLKLKAEGRECIWNCQGDTCLSWQANYNKKTCLNIKSITPTNELTFKEWCKIEKLPCDEISKKIFNEWKVKKANNPQLISETADYFYKAIDGYRNEIKQLRDIIALADNILKKHHTEDDMVNYIKLRQRVGGF